MSINGGYQYDPNRRFKYVQCGTCGRIWDDSIVTSITPTPSARCPFEHFHNGEPIPDDYEVQPIIGAPDYWWWI